MTPFSCVGTKGDKNENQLLSTLYTLQLIHTDPSKELQRINDVHNATYTISGRVQANPGCVQTPGSFGVSMRVIALDLDLHLRGKARMPNDRPQEVVSQRPKNLRNLDRIIVSQYPDNFEQVAETLSPG